MGRGAAADMFSHSLLCVSGSLPTRGSSDDAGVLTVGIRPFVLAAQTLFTGAIEQMNLRRLVVVLVLSLGFGIGTCKAQEITIAAAADLQFVMQDVAARFQKET